MTDLVTATIESEIALEAATTSQAKGLPRAVGWSTAMLSIVWFLAAVDRQTFSVLLVPIQKDLKVNDAAMGLLTGSAFALVYAFVAIPLARLADRQNRRTIISIVVVLWSAGTAICGIVTGFGALMLARMGVGAAEAAQIPATMSMIGDLTPAHRRGTQVSIISAGATLGFALGGIIAGVLNDRFGWHVAMLVVGAPGVIVALVIYFTVPEPQRGIQDGNLPVPIAGETWLGALRLCVRIKTLYPFGIGFFCTTLAQTGFLLWMPAFLMRVHHLTATQMGGVFFAIVGCGIFGGLAGGPVCDLAARRGPRWRLYYCCASLLIAAPFLFAGMLAPSLPVSVALMLVFTFFMAGLTPASAAIYLSVAPANIRGVVTAIMNALALGLGAGLAPVLFGAINDALHGTYGVYAVRYTLLLAPTLLAVSAVLFFAASPFIDRDVEAITGVAADCGGTPD